MVNYNTTMTEATLYFASFKNFTYVSLSNDNKKYKSKQNLVRTTFNYNSFESFIRETLNYV